MNFRPMSVILKRINKPDPLSSIFGFVILHNKRSLTLIDKLEHAYIEQNVALIKEIRPFFKVCKISKEVYIRVYVNTDVLYLKVLTDLHVKEWCKTEFGSNRQFEITESDHNQRHRKYGDVLDVLKTSNNMKIAIVEVTRFCCLQPVPKFELPDVRSQQIMGFHRTKALRKQSNQEPGHLVRVVYER
ncbi:uncharacterized protein EV154DRAFT_557251 [Mucor mucedo]|uniref:uncharacterized protein n=1 Tax=Mucor mucedo TaxID=29922 RepID=UPI00221FB4D4|nr:uncharacterized protein EV154DRAFT_557251 [Mucor mucedo]KAI7865226.1 hypothetical protein EV154DRAFT_557251 [Mucor mucedo]